MIEKRQRRRFTKEFKTEAVELSLRSEKTMSEIAGDLGIRVELLYRWKGDYLTNKDHAFPGSGHLHDPEEERVRQLERELRSTQEERDILKKANHYKVSPREYQGNIQPRENTRIPFKPTM